MQIPVQLSLNFLWGDKNFEKSDWGSINYIVGANGTGKSIFVEQLVPILKQNSLSVRYLSTDRLVDFTKQKYLGYTSTQLNQGINFEMFQRIKASSFQRGESVDAFVLLRENLDIRIKVESILSQLLDRKIILEEKGGFMIPKVVLGTNQAYDFKENESHGLKEIITLLTLLHDDTYNCIIIDEPELHLHPQFQTFLLQEIRKHAGDPFLDNTKKIFFIVTHSPHFVDIRTIEELKNVIVFQPNKIPTYIDKISSDDEYKVNALLPRLNTHHKQFFFSSKPIFVEGNTDQQIFSLIQEKRGKFVGASGSTFIDVNGKDELDLFFRLCKELSIDCRMIVDLDMVLDGRLRESVSSDKRTQEFLQKQGISPNFFKGLSEIWQKLDECVAEFLKIFLTLANPSSEIDKLYQILLGKEKTDCRYPFLLAIQRIQDELQVTIPNQKGNLEFIHGRIKQIIEASKKANVHILSKGELENYFKGIENHFNLTQTTKTKSFLIERDFLLLNQLTEEELTNKYGELIEILDKVTTEAVIDYKQGLLIHIQDFVYAVQKSFLLNKDIDLEGLKINKTVNYDLYKNVLDIIDFVKTDKSFNCKIKIKNFGDELDKTIEFNNTIHPMTIEI